MAGRLLKQTCAQRHLLQIKYIAAPLEGIALHSITPGKGRLQQVAQCLSTLRFSAKHHRMHVTVVSLSCLLGHYSR